MSIVADKRLQERWVNQVDFIDEDDRLDTALFGGNQDAVDQIRLQPRLGGTGDDEDLVDVGYDDVLAASTCTADAPSTWLDTFDDPFSGILIRIFNRPESHQVASHHDVTLIGTKRFEESAGSTFVGLTVFRLDDAYQASNRQDPAGQGRSFVHFELDAEAWFVFVTGLDTDDRPMSSQFTLAADPLTRDSVLFLEPVLVILPSPVGRSRSDLSIFFELGPDLLLFLFVLAIGSFLFVPYFASSNPYYCRIFFAKVQGRQRKSGVTSRSFRPSAAAADHAPRCVDLHPLSGQERS